MGTDGTVTGTILEFTPLEFETFYGVFICGRYEIRIYSVGV